MKAQTSIEASLIITFMMLMLVSFMGIFAKQTIDTQQDRQVNALESIAEIIQREVALASEVSSGYKRNFSLPTKAGDWSYNVTLINSTTIGTNYSELIVTANDTLEKINTVKLLAANVSGRICIGVNLKNMIEKKKDSIHFRCASG